MPHQLGSAKIAAGVMAALVVPAIVAAQTATQVVQFRVDAVSQIAVSGAPAPLVVSAAVAGDAPSSATASTTTYAVTTNEANQKIVASINQPMPAGTALEVTLGAPTGASSVGFVPLATAGADVVTGISAQSTGALPITYRLSASAAAGVSSSTRTVTYTIVAGT